jgi:hypothetical protein
VVINTPTLFSTRLTLSTTLADVGPTGLETTSKAISEGLLSSNAVRFLEQRSETREQRSFQTRSVIKAKMADELGDQHVRPIFLTKRCSTDSPCCFG